MQGSERTAPVRLDPSRPNRRCLILRFANQSFGADQPIVRRNGVTRRLGGLGFTTSRSDGRARASRDHALRPDIRLIRCPRRRAGRSSGRGLPYDGGSTSAVSVHRGGRAAPAAGCDTSDVRDRPYDHKMGSRRPRTLWIVRHWRGSWRRYCRCGVGWSLVNFCRSAVSAFPNTT